MKNKIKVYGIICARGGSKGLKNKNILPLKGKPLIAHSINQGLRTKKIKKILVSTDSVKISKVAKKYGAHIPFLRPKKLSNDNSSEWKVWQHLVKFLEKNKDLPDIIISIPTTSPLRKINDLSISIDKFIKNKNSDILITITESRRNPYFNMVKINQKNFLEIVNFSKKKLFNRQQAPKTYDVCTVAYVTTPNYILNSTHIFQGNVDYHEVKKDTAIDIDDRFDYEIAKKFFRK